MKRNYVPGEFEEVTAQAAGVITFDALQYFVLDGDFKFTLSDVVVYADGVLLAPSAYELATDVKYTDIESTRSAKTLYAQIKVTDAQYDGQALTVDGNNFGTATDNEAVVSYADTAPKSSETITVITEESISGTAGNQRETNIEGKGAIEANTESILNLTGASMKIAEFGGTFATTEVMFDFDTITPSDNTDLLDADDTTNIVDLKKPLRYEFQTFISVISTGGGAKTLTLRVYNNADDSLLSTRTQAVQGGNNNAQQFPLDTVLLDNPIENLEIYFTAQCTDTQLDLVELNTTIATGGGGGGGVWGVQDGEIVNIGLRPVAVTVSTAGIGDVTIAGTGTAYDATYSDTGNDDTFGNPTLSNGVNTLIKDDTNAFWCLVTGVTTTSPDFATSQYCNFTGSIEGIYTVVLGAGTDGTATIASGGAGSQAIKANSDIVAPVFEVTGKASRRYNYEEGYIQDSLIEPESGAAYVTVANGVPREATPVSGAGKMKQIYRSLAVGGVIDPNPNLATDVGNTLFDPAKIPCDTDATGADLGVGGSVQVLGKSYLDGGITTIPGVAGTDAATFGQLTEATKYFVSTWAEFQAACASVEFYKLIIVTASINVPDAATLTVVETVVVTGVRGLTLKNMTITAISAASLTFDTLVVWANSITVHTVGYLKFYARRMQGNPGQSLTLTSTDVQTFLEYELLTQGALIAGTNTTVTQDYWDNTFIQSDVSTLDIPERAALGTKGFMAREDFSPVTVASSSHIVFGTGFTKILESSMEYFDRTVLRIVFSCETPSTAVGTCDILPPMTLYENMSSQSTDATTVLGFASSGAITSQNAKDVPVGKYYGTITLYQ